MRTHQGFRTVFGCFFRFWLNCGLGLLTVAPLFAQLPRIAVRQGSQRVEFVNTKTGIVFVPEGNTLYTNHCEFHPGHYTPAAVESELAQMRQFGGYNVVRVFIASGPCSSEPRSDGVGGSQYGRTPQLSPEYLANFIDFLTRAARHRIYVVPVLAWVPYTSYYIGMTWQGRPANLQRPGQTEDVNAYYLFAGSIESKRQYVREFVRTIRDTNPALLTSIFAFEIENEVHLRSDLPPFDRNSGWVQTADGISYDMSSAASRQQCMDANLVHWANSVAASIRSVDPQAMVTASVFTYRASGKPLGPNGLLTPPGVTDFRHPARPLVFAYWARALSYLDIHLYPTTSYNMDDDLRSSEFQHLPPNAALVMGEFGPELMGLSSITAQAVELGRTRTSAYNRRFLGAFLWTWNLAKAGGGAVNGVLAPNARVTASATHPSTAPHFAIDGDPATAWNAGRFAPAWIQVDLGRARSISGVTLAPSQFPNGTTVHEVWGGTNLNDMRLMRTVSQYTESGRNIPVSFSTRPLRFLRVVTRSSPSWVAWQEITVQDMW